MKAQFSILAFQLPWQQIKYIAESAHIPPAAAIRGMLKQFCRSKFLIFVNWRDRKKKKNEGTSIFWLLVVGVHNRSTLFPLCVSSFNFVGLTEKCDKKINVLEFERKKIEEIKKINKHQQPDPITHDTSTYCPCVDQVSTVCASQSLRKER